MANSPYLKSSGAASATGGAGGPIRGSNASLPGSGYAGIQGSLDFNTGVCHYIQGNVVCHCFLFFWLGHREFLSIAGKRVLIRTQHMVLNFICF